MYIICVILCLFSALSRRVGALQISIIIIIILLLLLISSFKIAVFISAFKIAVFYVAVV